MIGKSEVSGYVLVIVSSGSQVLAMCLRLNNRNRYSTVTRATKPANAPDTPIPIFAPSLTAARSNLESDVEFDRLEDGRIVKYDDCALES